MPRLAMYDRSSSVGLYTSNRRVESGHHGVNRPCEYPTIEDYIAFKGLRDLSDHNEPRPIERMSVALVLH